MYCCGAAMIGAIGSLRKHTVFVHNVPLLYCPVCHEIEIHPSVKEEFDLVVQYAVEDGVKETTLRDQIDPDLIEEWKEYCVTFQEGDLEPVLREQVDYALDLLSASKQLGDLEWGEELKNRLKVLTTRLKRLEEQKEGSR